MVNIFGWVELVEGEVVAMCIWLQARLWLCVFVRGCRDKGPTQILGLGLGRELG